MEIFSYIKGCQLCWTWIKVSAQNQIDYNYHLCPCQWKWNETSPKFCMVEVSFPIKSNYFIEVSLEQDWVFNRKITMKHLLRKKSQTYRDTNRKRKNKPAIKDPELSGRTLLLLPCSMHGSSTVPDKRVLSDFMMHTKWAHTAQGTHNYMPCHENSAS